VNKSFRCTRATNRQLRCWVCTIRSGPTVKDVHSRTAIGRKTSLKPSKAS